MINYSDVIVSYQVPRVRKAWPWYVRHSQNLKRSSLIVKWGLFPWGFFQWVFISVEVFQWGFLSMGVYFVSKIK